VVEKSSQTLIDNRTSLQSLTQCQQLRSHGRQLIVN